MLHAITATQVAVRKSRQADVITMKGTDDLSWAEIGRQLRVSYQRAQQIYRGTPPGVAAP
ncbi:hypothetical protein BJ973_004013 [Actinoplanes tereljensis]|uniref:Uncharacterized protein n=1 Tax=Paractinoplanes tereljensis TaxID=571912 RepID=A0A919NWP8_9ACTN|nr:hypothetical protein [Actinoplanes tereljensis]GIF25738.1 hypothetical protein Ate02nite_84680 [Actinoplanes tereljensis]